MVVRRRPGRPPLDPEDPSTQVGVRLPSKQVDRLCHEAHVARCSLSAWVRYKLTRAAPDGTRGDDDERS